LAAEVIDGRAVAAAVRERVAVEVEAYVAERGRPPALATVLVGEDPASEVYIRNKHRACEEVGIASIHHGLPADTAEEDLLDLVTGLGLDDAVDGILVQLPLPDQIDPDALVGTIDPAKDVDGLTPVNAGLLAHGTPGLTPCTPAGVMELLRSRGVELEGAEAVVVGRSKLVGVPVARLLLDANATVTVCHSRTRDLDAVCRRAEVLVAAVGVPKLLGAEAVKPGAVVIDVGMNRTDDGLSGDVDFEAAAEVASAITPVPGGVGPMTIAMLLVNTMAAARARV
jgi:methylenetetrahydrofolate dehydrogenase (NADP+)/methenyltetrahydrofolate cyclohydrolase